MNILKLNYNVDLTYSSYHLINVDSRKQVEIL